MRSSRGSALLLTLGLAFPLTHCGDDDGSPTPIAKAGSSGEAGEGHGGDATGAAATTGQGGNAEGVAGAEGLEGGSGGAPSSGQAGNGAAGGAPSNGAAGSNAAAGNGSGGDGDGAGGACNVTPDPTNCCQPADPACVDDWAMECYNDWNTDHFCCDADLGVRRRCNYDGDFYHYRDVVCIDECTGKSFGTETCDECLIGEPPCAANGGCPVGMDVCENASAGYALECLGDQLLFCVCDPDL